MEGRIRVTFLVKALQKKSLSGLLHEFKKFNGNEGLIEDIDKLVPERNHIAHMAFYQLYSHLEDGTDLGEIQEKTVQVRQNAGKCVELLQREIDHMEKLVRDEYPHLNG